MDSVCVECRYEMTEFDRGWRLMRITDPDSGEVVLASYCPVCAERELDDGPAELDWSSVVGGVQVTKSSRMEFVIEFDSDDADVVVSTSGPAHPGGFRQLSRALACDARFQPMASILIDHSALDAGPLTAAGFEQLQAAALAVRERLAAAQIALVVPELGESDAARRLAEHAQVMSPTARAFRARAEAAVWLQRLTSARAPHQA